MTDAPACAPDGYVVDRPLAWWTGRIRESQPGGPLRLASHRIDVPATMAAGQRWPMHAHVDHELLWGIGGCITVVTPGRINVVPSGASIWIPAWVPHDVHAGPASALSCTWFAEEARGAQPDGVTVLVTPRLLDDVLEHLMDEGISDDRRRTAEAFALDLLAPAPRVDVELPLPTSPWLRAIADALVANPGDTRTVQELAHQSQVSVRTLMRRFSTETGMVLSTWRIELRIRVAMQRLSAGDTIAGVARATGFSSPSAFGVAFRRITGVTPGAFLRGQPDS